MLYSLFVMIGDGKGSFWCGTEGKYMLGACANGNFGSCFGRMDRSVGNVSFVVHVFANYLHVRPVYFHEQSIFTNNEYNLYTRLRSTISRSS